MQTPASWSPDFYLFLPNTPTISQLWLGVPTWLTRARKCTPSFVCWPDPEDAVKDVEPESLSGRVEQTPGVPPHQEGRTLEGRVWVRNKLPFMKPLKCWLFVTALSLPRLIQYYKFWRATTLLHLGFMHTQSPSLLLVTTFLFPSSLIS